MPVEQFQEPRGNGGVGAIVKGGGNLVPGIGMPQCGAEYLRRGGDSSPGGAARQSRRAHDDRPGIQFLSTLRNSRMAASKLSDRGRAEGGRSNFIAGLTLLTVAAAENCHSASTIRPGYLI